MPEKYLDKVYTISNAPDAQCSLYNEWAETYDAELGEGGYATPARLAAALGAAEANRDAPVLDFGCGTGLSGAALAAAGFTTIDGCDLSEGMLQEARAKGVYRDLWTLTPGVLDVAPGTYAAITACGVISTGAAPAATLDLVAQKVGPGGRLVFSYNDHAMESPDYVGRLDALLKGGFVEISRETGTHIAGLGSTSTVFVLERRA